MMGNDPSEERAVVKAVNLERDVKETKGNPEYGPVWLTVKRRPNVTGPNK